MVRQLTPRSSRRSEPKGTADHSTGWSGNGMNIILLSSETTNVSSASTAPDLKLAPIASLSTGAYRQPASARTLLITS